MEKLNLNSFTRGWLVGNFEPAIFNTNDFEFGIKRLEAGYTETRHHHKLSTEVTIIISGRVIMNGNEYGPDDIIILPPGESSDFKCLTDVVTCAIRNGSNKGDKWEEDAI